MRSSRHSEHAYGGSTPVAATRAGDIGDDPTSMLDGAGHVPLDQLEVDHAVEVFRMLADGTRVRLLWALLAGEQPVNALADSTGKSGTSVSQHLAKLRMARLVATRRDGAQIYYRLENDHVARLVLDAVRNAEHAGPGVPAHHRDDVAADITR